MEPTALEYLFPAACADSPDTAKPLLCQHAEHLGGFRCVDHNTLKTHSRASVAFLNFVFLVSPIADRSDIFLSRDCFAVKYIVVLALHD